jgi:hypothetical protein
MPQQTSIDLQPSAFDVAWQQMLRNKKIGTMKTSEASVVEAIDRWCIKRLAVTQPSFL